MYNLICGNSLEELKKLADNSIDSIVTDPPYELGFMGKKWDSTGIAFNIELWQEALRVLKPGGHLIAFSGSRTYHRMAVAIEDAGFEIRDQIMWVYGSGFPKSLDVSKAIDKKFGAEREVVSLGKSGSTSRAYQSEEETTSGEYQVTAPSTPQAKQWQGWGTALKPSHEPMVLARKPLLEKTVAENVLKWGVGGLNIDGCRVEYENTTNPATNPKFRKNNGYKQPERGQESNGSVNFTSSKNEINDLGRWPANFIHAGQIEEEWNRYFYCAKASKKDRNEGCEDIEPKLQEAANYRPHQMEEALNGESGDAYGRYKPQSNNHPTVKPTDLMAYLVRLVTPPNGTVLDPFNGSGSTGKACMRENFNYIGIDLSQEYLDISKARIEYELNKKTNNPV